MWIKFDGMSAIIKIPETDLEFKTDFTVNKWYQLIEHNGTLYIDGEDQKED
jgi:hypothetical protein